MPTLPQVLSQLQFITQETSLLGLFITASIILLWRDWRSLILALLIQYILIGIILSRLVRPDIATLKVMIGAFICPILFLSVRQVSAAESPFRSGESRIFRLFLARLDPRGAAATGFVFRLLAACLMILVATTLSASLLLPGLPPSVNTAVFWLIMAGLVTLSLTEEPLKAGLGLFTVFSGFELFYATVENSLLVTGLWGAVNLLMALAVGYLIVIHRAGPEAEL